MLPMFCKLSRESFIGKIKNIGKVIIANMVNVRPVMMRTIRAPKPSTRENIAKTNLCKKSKSAPSALSSCHGAKRVLKSNGTEKELYADLY